MKPLRLVIAAMAVSATVAAVAPSRDAGAAVPKEPLWVTHVRSFPGGISNGVRASLDPAAQAAQARALAESSAGSPHRRAASCR